MSNFVNQSETGNHEFRDDGLSGYMTHKNRLRDAAIPEPRMLTVTVLRRPAEYPVVIPFAMVASFLPAKLAVYEKACSAK
ncbi:hypothetical protein [Hyphomicrobium sp.]|uniref:hypothetical protein n=1 Tax=Hyphomicrobium sp. TaxID=82 RepID=UPI001DE0E544|nr:hypothetical protein [Hyphomicrobium sp.]MBY0558978.1 hypothetical protein [Hyphomicrobium sp.]